jgi:glycosyltransferase involved in cell wall biosynthesis
LGKRIIVSVISDLVTDQRVQKECNTFLKLGYEILLIGRKSKNDFGLNELPYKVVRLKNFFKGGPQMYLMFNTQLLFYLLFKRADILWANDLDTLLPNFLIARLKKIKLVYDSHEYFTMSVYKRTSRKIWQRLENFLFPKLKNVITVNDSIKKMYEEKYKVPITVIRNVPYKNDLKSLGKIDIAEEKKILIIQGAGINENRGAEEAVEMMQFLPDEFLLLFVGGGTVIEKLKRMVNELKLENKVMFIGVLPYHQMMNYTRQSYLGLIFEKVDFTDEHNFALPNRFFDYVKAGIPVLSTKAIEIKALIEKYNIGTFVDNLNPAHLAEKIMQISEDASSYNCWKSNTAKAASDLCWENEEKKLIEFMNNIR